MRQEPNTNVLLSEWKRGDHGAREYLFERLHPHLAQIAAARLRGENNPSLSTDDLINDAVVRLIDIAPDTLHDRAHVMALASRIMRHILVDHARAKASAKRAHVRVELCTKIDGGQRFDLLSLDSALMRLKAIDEQLTELVEMRYFGGMSIADVAVAMQLSEPTVKRRWQVARAWLADALDNPIDDV